MIPFEEVPSRVYGQLFGVITGDKSIRRVTKYLSEKLVVSVAAKTYGAHKGKRTDNRSRAEDFVVKVGAPNYAERQFIKKCKAAGEPFPIKKIQLKFVKQ